MSLTPEQIELLVDKYIIGLYQDMEREIIADIARRVKKTGRYTETAELMAKAMVEQGYSAQNIQAEVMELLRADKAYQMAVAENTKTYKRQVQEIIDKTLEEVNKGNKELIAEAGNMAWNNDLSMWQEHGVDLKKPNSMSQLLTAFRIQTAKELKNLTRTMGFKNTALGATGVMNMYQKELDLAVLKVASGTFSYDQAVNDCVRRLAQSGLRSINYASGRSYQLDTAARMATRTGISQLAGRVTEMNLQATGQDLVVTSQHMGSRPEHAPIQNKVFSFSGKSRKYPDFKAPIGRGGAGYGTAEGIKGPNCTHDYYPYWEGNPIPEDIEYDEAYYQNTQKQRAMERNIRATKREIEAMKAIGEDTKELNRKLRKQISDYHSFSDSVGIRPKDNRLRVVSGTSDLKKTAVYKRANKSRTAASTNTGKKVTYNPQADYKIELSEYPEKVSQSMTEAAREVAKLGSSTGYEYGVFVDLKNGEIGKYVTDRLSNSVRPDYEYLKNNPDVRVAFLHNHNTDTELSFPDVCLIANEVEINIVAAVRNDGIITLVESNGRKTTDYLPFEYLQYTNEIRKKMMTSTGYINEKELEILLRNKAMAEFSKEGMCVYGNDI